MRNIGGMILTGKQNGPLFRRKTCSNATLVSHAPTWPGEVRNLVLRGDSSVTSHATAIIVRLFTTVYLEQTTFLGSSLLLQLFCVCNVCHVQCYFPCKHSVLVH